MTTDTIAAISTAPGRAAIAVVRLSGPDAVLIAGKVYRGKEKPGGFTSHSVRHGKAFDSSGRLIDEVLISVMRGPDSYTGEDVVEISCHGGLLVSRLVLEALIAAGARPAEPGEFTRRAFLNDKMDLAQAEAVAEIVSARTRQALERALGQLEGGISEELQAIRAEVVGAMAEVEARIDFPDDVPECVDAAGLSAALGGMASRLRPLVSERVSSALLSVGARVPIVGRPNVGKSSLLNAILGRGRAIVNPEPGTTRDTVEEETDIEGIPVRLIDTAGLRSAREEIEEEGVRRSIDEISRSDAVVFVVDASAHDHAVDAEILEGIYSGQSAAAARARAQLVVESAPTEPAKSGGVVGWPGAIQPGTIGVTRRETVSPELGPFESKGVDGVRLRPTAVEHGVPSEPGSETIPVELERPSLGGRLSQKAPRGKPVVIAVNKVDIASPKEAEIALAGRRVRCAVVQVSAKDGTGIELLEKTLAETILGSELVMTEARCASQRHLLCLRGALDSIERAREALEKNAADELVAFELREAAEQLAAVTGESVGPDVLDAIFSKFCVGK